MHLADIIIWVAQADQARGRAVALALAAAGVKVLVTGRSERAIAECVGEIAHAGGKARHFVGDAATDAGARACRDSAVARFGALHAAILGEADSTACDSELRVVRLAASVSEEEAARCAVALARRVAS